jgi:hypothetical protein
LLVALSAFGQSEQWLEYHTGEGASYHALQMTTNPPEGVALPKLNETPYFARWATPMDPSGGRWLCIDRTRKSGPYNRLFIDDKGNGRLDDKAPIMGKMDSSYSVFSPVPLVFKGEDGPITYHLGLRFYKYDDNSTAQLLATACGWYEGTVNFAGTKKHVRLTDGNVNGTFNDINPNPGDSDCVEIEGAKAGDHYLGRLLEVGDQVFRIEAARDGAFVKVKKADDVVYGQVHVPPEISEFAAYGENGHFDRKPTNGDFALPTGKYHIYRWLISRKDDKGVPWTLSGYRFPADGEYFNVTTNQTVTLEIGEPVIADVKANEGADREITLSLNFEGRQKEAIEMLRNGERPARPKIALSDASGSLCYTNSFEFG